MAQLVEDNRRLQATISKLRDTTSSQTARLEEELAGKSRSVEIIEEKLSAQSDYDEVKRELRSHPISSLCLSSILRRYLLTLTLTLFLSLERVMRT